MRTEQRFCPIVHPSGPAETEGLRFQRPCVILVLLGAVFAVHFLDRQVLAILIPPIKAELQLSDTSLNLLSGFAFTVIFSTVGLVIARVADRIADAMSVANPRRKALVIAVCQAVVGVSWLPAMLSGDKTIVLVKAIVPLH